MIRIPDDHVIQLARGMLDRGDHTGALETLRSVNTPEARELIGNASYSHGKRLVGIGQYGAAREFFTDAINHHPHPVVRTLAQERNHLLGAIAGGATKDVGRMLEQLTTLRISRAETMHPETFAPLISFVGCPAAYRSGYDPERSDPLSRLIRLVKRPAASDAALPERERTVERLGEILAAYAYRETEILNDCDFIVPVPSDVDRASERGYSIPVILAAKVAMSCAVPLESKVVEASGPLPELRQIPRWARRSAIMDAYRGTDKGETLTGMNVVVIDDVVTTGATLNEIALVLKEHGASNVYALILAHTEGSV